MIIITCGKLIATQICLVLKWISWSIGFNILHSVTTFWDSDEFAQCMYNYLLNKKKQIHTNRNECVNETQLKSNMHNWCQDIIKIFIFLRTFISIERFQHRADAPCTLYTSFWSNIFCTVQAFFGHRISF